jgi:hypothetical protein
MADLIYVAVLIGFFALAALFVRACDHIVGPDDEAPTVAPSDDAELLAEAGRALAAQR